MGNATVSSTGKTGNGTLHSVGGDGYDDYFMNLTALFDGNVIAVGEVLDEFRNVIRPLGGGGYAYGTSSPAPAATPPAYSQPRQGAGGAPGQTLCPSHQQPAEHINSPKGEFWKCPVNGTFINNYNAPGFKSACPAPKG